MEVLGFISWNINPNIVESPIMIRYYGLLWALSFILGFSMIKKMLQHEGQNPELADKFLTYTLVGGVVGARLGHVFFYDWEYYSQNLIEIVKIWKGGLASHGGTIGILISTWILSRRVTKRKLFWSLDKIVVVAAIAASLIRVGNLMNSEIIGAQSNSQSAFFFEYEARNSVASYFNVDVESVILTETENSVDKNGFSYPEFQVKIEYPNQLLESDVQGNFSHFYEYKNYNYHPENEDHRLKEEHYFALEETPVIVQSPSGTNVIILIAGIPRIPTQLLEAGSYLLIFLILMWGYWKRRWYEKEGLLFGLFLILLFSARFIIEFWKEHQTLSDDASLNMGQWLSIPAVLAGVVIVLFAFKNQKVKA